MEPNLIFVTCCIPVFHFLSVPLLFSKITISEPKQAVVVFGSSAVFHVLIIAFHSDYDVKILAALSLFAAHPIYLYIFWGLYVQPKRQIHKDKHGIRDSNLLISFEFKEMNDLLYFRFQVKSALFEENASRISNIDLCTVQTQRIGKQISLRFEKPIVGKKHTYFGTIRRDIRKWDFVERFSCKEIQFTCSKKDAKTIVDTLKLNGIEVIEKQ